MGTIEFYKKCKTAVEQLRNFAPKDTGNLAFNSIKYEFLGDKCIIYISEDIAQYMPFTNEEWVSPKWHGKKNPNQNWFDRTAEYIYNHLNRELNK